MEENIMKCRKPTTTQSEQTRKNIETLADILTYRKQNGALSEMVQSIFDENEQKVIKDKIFELIEKI